MVNGRRVGGRGEKERGAEGEREGWRIRKGVEGQGEDLS